MATKEEKRGPALKRKLEEVSSKLAEAKELHEKAIASMFEVDRIDSSSFTFYQENCSSMQHEVERLEGKMCKLQRKLDMIPHQEVLKECQQFLADATYSDDEATSTDDDDTDGESPDEEG